MGEFYTKAVGVTFNNSQRVIARLKVGEQLRFVREPDNPYDRFAVRIETMSGENVGHISRNQSEQISTNMLRGVNYRVYVSAVTGGGFDSNYGVNLRVVY